MLDLLVTYPPRRVSSFLAVSPVERSAYFSPMEEVADMEKAGRTDIAIGRGRFSVESGDATGDGRFSLCDIDLSVEKGDFIGIIGKVGKVCQMAKFDPVLSLDYARVEGVGRNPRNGRDQILQRSVAEP